MNRKTIKHIKKEITGLLLLIAIIASVFIFIDVIRYPEAYSSIAKYHLKNDIEAGNEKAIEFYNEHYLSKGRPLF